jgi:ABC-type nitrate/sulfonate/bicarbonate transport system permease component
MTTQVQARQPATAVARHRSARRATFDSNAGRLVSQSLVVLGFLAVWAAFSRTAIAERADMPGPLAVAERLGEFIVTAGYWTALGATIGSWSIALVTALVVGIPIGLAIGRHSRAFDSSKWTIDFLRTIPSVAFVPLALLLLGRSQAMVVIVAVIPAIWPLIIQSIYAGQQADPVLHRVARSFRLTWQDRLRYVLAPDALAFIWPGIRLATTAALLVTVFAELLGGAKGIGSEIMEAQIYNRPENLYAWVVTACFLGLLINGGLSMLQRRLLWWHPSLRGRSTR